MLEKRQLDLLILIGCAILLPSIGGSIRHYFDTSGIECNWYPEIYGHIDGFNGNTGCWLNFTYLLITLGLTIALFIIIMKYIKYVFPRRDKSINIQGDIV